MEITLIIVFVLTALLLNLVIVLQPGKGSGMGALGGGGGTSGGATSVFGARGAVPFLSKLTAWLAALFMMLSLGLARISLDKSAISVSALKPPIENTAGAGADEDEKKSDEGDDTKAAEGDKAPEAAKTPEGDKAAEADKPADGEKKEEPAPAESEKKKEGGE